MGTTTDKTTYLNTTKLKIKDGINRLGGELTNLSTFRSYANALDSIYNALPKVSGEGSNISLTPTLEGGLNILPLGNTEQKTYIGNQLIPFTNQDFTLKGVRYYVQNGELYVNGTSIAETSTTSTEFKENFSFTLTAGTYYIKRNTENLPFAINKKSDNTTILNYQGSFTLAEDTEVYIGFYVYQKVFNNNLIDTMVNQGSTLADYEPYTNGASPNSSYPQDVKVVTGDNQVVVQNKNLCDIVLDENISSTILYKTYTLKPNTNYTVSTNTFITEPYDIANVFAVSGTTITPSTVNNGVNGNKVITSDSNGNITIAYRNESNKLDYSSGDYYIQIEEGSTATTYVAHQEQSYILHLGDIKLNGIGNYIDLPFKDGDTWKIKRRVGKVVLDGSENNWSYNAGNGFLLLNTDTTFSLRDLTVYNGFCNYFTVNKNSTTWTNLNYIGWNSTNTFWLKDNGNIATNVDDFKTWLSSHNTIVYYVLSEPTKETITNTTLIEELNNLQELLSYDGTTNITITSNSDNAQMLVQVSALKGE